MYLLHCDHRFRQFPRSSQFLHQADHPHPFLPSDHRLRGNCRPLVIAQAGNGYYHGRHAPGHGPAGFTLDAGHHHRPGVDDLVGLPDTHGRFQAQRFRARYEPIKKKPCYGLVVETVQEPCLLLPGFRARSREGKARCSGSPPMQPSSASERADCNDCASCRTMGANRPSGAGAGVGSGAGELVGELAGKLAGELAGVAVGEAVGRTVGAGVAVGSGGGVLAGGRGVAAMLAGDGVSVASGVGAASVQASITVRNTKKAAVKVREGCRIGECLELAVAWPSVSGVTSIMHYEAFLLEHPVERAQREFPPELCEQQPPLRADLRAPGGRSIRPKAVDS